MESEPLPRLVLERVLADEQLERLKHGPPLLTNAQLYLLKDQIAALRSINLQLRAAREAQRAGLPTGAELSAPPAHSAAEALPQPPPGSAQPPADSEPAVSQAGAAKKQSGGKLRVAAAKTAAKSAVKGRPAP